MVTPERLGRYEIRGVLGSGAMGTVYTAWDPDLARGVALKIIRNPQVDEEALRRFRREAQALARLTHPHIVAVHDIGADDGAPYIVMELIEGTTLAGEIAAGVGRPLTEKVALAAQVCDALAFAHAAGIIHRDVKPGNILITRNGVAKLADFGLARLQHSSLTGSADVVGTPAYLAPEAFSGAELDARADVYGIAASVFEWVSGSRPHEAEHLATLMARVLHHDAPDVRDKWSACPPSLAACLRRGLARDRSERHQSAAEFGKALRALTGLDSVNEDARSTVVLEANSPMSSGQARGRRIALVGVAAVLLLLIGAGLASQITPDRDAVAVADPMPSAEPPVPAASTRAAPEPPADTPKAAIAAPRSKPAALGVVPAPLSTTETAKTEAAADEDELEPPPAAVPIGTKVMVAIQTVLRTDRTARGDAFEGVLADPLLWNGREVAAAASRVRGIVDLVIPGTGDRPPALQLSLTSIQIGGEPTRVRTARYEIVAPPFDGGARVRTLIVGAIGGAAIGGVVGGAKGAAAGAAIGASAAGRPTPSGGEYVIGDRLTFRLAEPLRLQPGTE